MALISTGTAGTQERRDTALTLFQWAVHGGAGSAKDGSSRSAGAILGSGRLAFLSEENGCEPRTVTVVALADIARDLAVAVDGRPDSVFILGARCAGYEGEERARCILEPLAYDGSPYSGARSGRSVATEARLRRSGRRWEARRRERDHRADRRRRSLGGRRRGR